MGTLFLIVKSYNFSRWLFTESINVGTTNRVHASAGVTANATASYLSSHVRHQVVPQSLFFIPVSLKAKEVVQGTSVLPAVACHSEV